jgi:hypothetical protein
VIEYIAPRTYRRNTAEKPSWFVGGDFVEFVEKVQKLCPPDQDPLLVNRSETNRRLPLAGQAYHRARLAEVRRDEEATKEAWQEFVREWTDR